MFVLQECSICFEDFDNERNPHSPLSPSVQHDNPTALPGHVFCRPCLNSLASTSRCPNCRTSYAAQSIRKVVCAQQESTPAESEEEMLMWQAIKSAAEASNEYEQRKSLVTHNSLETVRGAGMSPVRPCLFRVTLRVGLSWDENLQKLLIALDVLRMLVEAEQQIHALKDEVDTAQAVEESLDDHISTLEARLSGKTGESG
ncbi:hypothetical protein FRC10_007878 [Ceratobasidium sp. 414]|nr:hypothetical protein FRC10_007878 [Ceratobasidium sp. 414]